MPYDVERIRQLLQEVRNTTGHKSAQKADELLRYVTRDREAATAQKTPLKSQDNASLSQIRAED